MPPNIDCYAWINERTEARSLDFARRFLAEDGMQGTPLEVPVFRMDGAGRIDETAPAWVAFENVRGAIAHGIQHRGDGFAIYMEPGINGIDRGYLCFTCDGHTVFGISFDEGTLVNEADELGILAMVRCAQTLRELSMADDVIVVGETPPPMSNGQFDELRKEDLLSRLGRK